ncbi:MAG: hypothetical protein JWO81_1662 [Alphaproteobacteria bacterium]|nr:hypothetical protein [Alphaproteobacteria bacterium]
MRPSLRFLALAVAGWAGVRAATLGVLPGASLFTIERSEAKPAPPIVPTAFPPIDPVQPEAAAPASGYYPAAVPYGPVQQMVPLQVRPVVVPVYYGVGSVRVPMPPARPARLANVLPEPELAIYPQFPPIDDSPLSRLASMSMAQRRSSVVVPGQSTPVLHSNAIERFQASAWALVRGRQGQVLGPTSLASGGQLGGSQAGARILYSFMRQIAASFRTSSDVGRRGAEIAAGVRVQPVGGLPIWITAERRQRIGQFGGGRNAFAIFAEGGVYQRPMPGQFSLDAYLQAGVVGLHSRDKFVDGGLTLTRPVYKKFSAGFGVWGDAQPGLYRIDAGPRVTIKVRNNVRVHLDWRQKLAGNAQPGSGPALTLAGDF